MTTTTKTKTYTDPQGQIVPAKYVKPYDRERDKLARQILADWQAEQARLRALKARTLDRIDKLQALAEKTAGVKLGGKKGNVQFRSFDGTISVQYKNQARTEFDERLSIAQELIMEAVRDLGKDANHDLVEIATRAFTPRSSGRLDMQRVRELRSYNVRHPKWKQACEIIAECERKIGTRQYIFVSTRDDPTAQPTPVYLDIAVLDCVGATSMTPKSPTPPSRARASSNKEPAK